MAKLSAEHYYNAICAKLQFCVQIYKSGVQIYKNGVQIYKSGVQIYKTAHFVEIQTLLLLDAFYEFSRCDTCNCGSDQI